MRLGYRESGNAILPLPPAARRPAPREHGPRRGHGRACTLERVTSARVMSRAAAPRRPPLRSLIGQWSFPSLPSSHNGSEGNFRAQVQHQYRRAVADFDRAFCCGDGNHGVSLRPCTGPRAKRNERTAHASGAAAVAQQQHGACRGQVEESSNGAALPARGVTRDPRSRPTRSGQASGQSLGRSLRE